MNAIKFVQRFLSRRRSNTAKLSAIITCDSSSTRTILDEYSIAIQQHLRHLISFPNVDPIDSIQFDSL